MVSHLLTEFTDGYQAEFRRSGHCIYSVFGQETEGGAVEPVHRPVSQVCQNPYQMLDLYIIKLRIRIC